MKHAYEPVMVQDLNGAFHFTIPVYFEFPENQEQDR